MPMPPPVSVCLTTYNRSKLLPATLDSILCQTMGDFELIISDDNSPDDTEAVCRSYVDADRRVRYYRNPQNLRMPGNLNSAISHARGGLIANLHDGDLYRPDLLSKWRAALEAQPQAAFVFNALEVVDFNGGHIKFETPSFGSSIATLELTRYMLDRLDSPVWGTVMARCECYERSGRFNPRFGFISDVEMWMRLNMDYPVAYIGESLIKIIPREITHPFHYIDWKLEEISIDIHRHIIARMSERGLLTEQDALRQLRRIREKRWLFLLASSMKKRNRNVFVDGMSHFRREESWYMKAIGHAGLVLADLMKA
jgi:glycosyltransferase involved in cell wall biosynthesis